MLKKIIQGLILIAMVIIFWGCLTTTTMTTTTTISISALWSKTYGSGYDAQANSITATSDGCFVVAGYAAKDYAPGDTDFWVLKLDASGDTVWSKTYGGTAYEQANSIVKTSDGGFAVAGDTPSSAGDRDFWVLRLDASGDTVWSKTYGSTNGDYANSIAATSDGGFVVAGFTAYSDYTRDFLVIKTDASGDTVWSKSYGGQDNDVANSVIETSDGEFIVVGYTESYGAGDRDWWVLKLDASGNTVWSKTYGGTKSDSAKSVIETSDGEFVVAGAAQSFGSASSSFYVLKLDNLGNTLWAKTDGGIYGRTAISIVETLDGGFAVAGGVDSYDFSATKLDSLGNLLGSKVFDKSDYDQANSIAGTLDGGFVIAGYTGEINGDFWVLRLNTADNIK